MNLHGRPTAVELVAAVAEFLETEVREATDGQLNFHARVAANALRMVERELLGPVGSSGPGEYGEADARAALAELGFADEAALAAAIRTGALDARARDVVACLRRLVGHRLAAAHPGYAHTQEAAP